MKQGRSSAAIPVDIYFIHSYTIDTSIAAGVGDIPCFIAYCFSFCDLYSNVKFLTEKIEVEDSAVLC